MSYVIVMDTIEQKEKDAIELRILTKFQKKQVLSLVDGFLEENEESKKRRFPGMPKMRHGPSRTYRGGEDKRRQADVPLP